MYSVILLLAFQSCTRKNHDEVVLVIDSGSDLGEGAIWNDQTSELYWVNITGKILNIYNPSNENNKELFTGQMIGTVAPCLSGRVVVALQNGIYFMDPETGTKKLIADPEEALPDNRFNDGKCDPGGRFWAGTMSTRGEKQAGALYMLDTNGTVRKMIENVSISNGIAWSTKYNEMYYIDTPTQKVMAWKYDPVSGNIADRRTAVEIPAEMGAPDGMTMDEQGNLWIALWGGGSVGCWNPQSGELVRKIEVPAKNVTSCAFGGPGFETLYITTAKTNTSDDDLKLYPNTGGLFRVNPGVKGIKACFYNDDWNKNN